MIESDVHVHVRVGAERYALPVENVLELVATVKGA